MPVLLNIVYGLLLIFLSPVILWRIVRHGRYRHGLAEKLLGRLPRLSAQKPVVWFHAVSVGEVLQLQKVVAEFRTRAADRFQVLVTTSTDTGFELAASRFEGCEVSWFPLDFSWAVRTALSRIRPSLLVLMELEFWPNMLSACQNAGVQTAVINARMSERSFRGYRRVRRLLGPLFDRFSVVAAQSQSSAERLVTLGARASATHVTGSTKFDGASADRHNAVTIALRAALGISDDETVFIAGSTQAPEEQLAVDAWKSARADFPNLRLIVVPRHRERFDDVAAIISTSGCSLTRRSTITAPTPIDSSTVILLDTIGELGACWGLADIAFVGGSFGTRGGQNMLEPAAYGAAVMFGPKTRNFRDIVAQLKSAEAAIELASPEELQTQLRRLLMDRKSAAELGQRAQNFVLSQQGAIAKTVELLLDCLNPDSRAPSAKSTADGDE
ncbi:MAG: 3-deoxy-D-manno-octulosonic acid transferase [Planctomycetaceae bacterium]